VSPPESHVEHWTRTLGLAAHPEGGWFREVYRSPERVGRDGLPGRFPGERSLATSIYYLLAAGERSRFHRLRADEQWCHHAGGAMHLHLLERGGARKLVVGGMTPQATVPYGTWFAAEPEPGAAFALVGCFVSPGFEFEDFELAERDHLLAEFPGERTLVTRFTRAPGEDAGAKRGSK
jgi:predicted cupin superfamily sugar epimerase